MSVIIQHLGLHADVVYVKAWSSNSALYTVGGIYVPTTLKQISTVTVWARSAEVSEYTCFFSPKLL